MSNKDDELEKIVNEFKNEEARPAESAEVNEAAAEEAAEESAEETAKEVAEEAAEEATEEAAEAEATEEAVEEKVQPDKAEPVQEKAGKGKNKLAIIVIAVVAVIAIACAAVFGLGGKKGEEPSTETSTDPTTTTTEAPAPVNKNNPLTGEADFNEAAIGLRPIAVVVDNASGAKPQYNIDKVDIVVEGEVEGGETRLLWLLSDMTNLPDMLGPTRSARPSYVQFSELFDAIFVHYGGSHSKGDYVGGYEVIKKDKVDDIDGMSVSSCFKRTSDKKSPHNAAFLGNKVMEVINSKGYRTTIDNNSFAALSFNESVVPVSETACVGSTIKFSSRTRTHTFTYNAEDKLYTNQGDFKTPVSFTNVIVMSAESRYIVKENYKGSGKSETYLNYSLTSGTGTLISCGTAVEFTWSVDNGKLSFKDAAGKELKFNPGKSYIALVSSNNGGSVSVD